MKPSMVRSGVAFMAALILTLTGCSSGGDSSSVGLYDPSNPVVGPALLITGPTQIGSGSTGNYVAQFIDQTGKGVASVGVKLSTTLGTLAMNSTDGTTDANGELAFTLMARTQPANGSSTPGDPITGTATLSGTATYGTRTYTKTVKVQFTPTTFVFTSPTSTAANPARVPVNTRQTLNFQWFNNGVGVNAPVTFTTQGKDSNGADVNRGVLIDASGNTGSTLTVSTQNGVVSLDVLSSSAGNGIVIATDGASNVARLPLLFTGGTPATIALSAVSPIAANGASTVTAVVKDSAGNAVSGVTVSFALTGNTPAQGTLTRNSATTDPSGAASVVYNANGAVGTATVRATSGNAVDANGSARSTPAPPTFNIVINAQ